MFENLQKTEEHYLELESRLSAPEVLSDPAVCTRLMKEYSDMTPTVEAYRAWKDAGRNLEQVIQMQSDPDPDIRALADEEYKEARALQDRKAEELRLLLLPKDPNDGRNVMVEIRAGVGGDEAALFASDLFRMYSLYADARRFKLSVLSFTEQELGGYKEIVFMVEGAQAYSRLKFEGGVHRVQRVPETESQGRIHTSTATVAVIPEAEEVEVEIRPEDIVLETCKSSGAGGQHINKTESAVRITHKPTGIVVWCQEERSQFKNRDKAMKMLRTKLYEISRNEQNEKETAARRSMVGSGDRSEKIRTYNFPQNRVTDHRINLSLYHLDTFINGHIDEMVDALTAAETAARLSGSGTESNG